MCQKSLPSLILAVGVGPRYVPGFAAREGSGWRWGLLRAGKAHDRGSLLAGGLFVFG